MGSTSKVRRWWSKIGWRFAVLLMIGVVASWTIWHFATDRSRRTVREIQALNGLARAAYSIDTGVLGLRMQFGELDNIYFLGPQLDDGKLSVLDDLPRLRVLTLTNTRVTDDGLARLARCRDLNCLYVGNIDHTKLIGSAGARLATPPLAGGRGLEALKDLPKLQVVQLYGPRTSDDDLKGLEQLKRLVVLDLMDTRVTAEGVAELKKALPNCSVRCR